MSDWYMCPSDHPREYGENLLHDPCSNLVAGSSPRIRGELLSVSNVKGSRGIIPANTGRIHRDLIAVTVNGDHPREYGENTQRTQLILRPAGSSPRIRGESRKARLAIDPTRIIPANTGRILSAQIPESKSRDHPREYGENLRPATAPPSGVGSSPRIRGE